MMNTERQRINEIDEEIARLLQERAQLAQRIGRHKAERNRPTYDPAREAEVLRRVGQAPGPLATPAVQAVFTEIISACRALEHPVRVAFLGPENTFSHLAVRKRFGTHAVAVPLATISETFRAVEAEQAEAGVVPVENSTGGVIAETLDCLLDSSLRICAEAHIPVHISLVAPGRREDIRTLYTHPQPYAQTRAWLREHVPAAKVELVSSTVIAAQRAAADPAGAALATAEAGAAEGLQVLGENIEDVPSNRTRFFVIAARDAAPTGCDKTSLVFATAHRPGSLYEAIGTFAAHALNLTLIQSRPQRGQPWQYVFFVDFEGHREEEAVQVALAELQEHCSLVKVLGSYPAEKE